MRCQMPSCTNKSDCPGCADGWDDAHGYYRTHDAYLDHFCADCREIRADRKAQGRCEVCGAQPCPDCGDCQNIGQSDDYCNPCDGACVTPEPAPIHYQADDVWPARPRGL